MPHRQDDDLDWLYRRGRHADPVPPPPSPEPRADSRRATAPATAHVTARATRRPRRPRRWGRRIGIALLALVVYLVAVPVIAWSGLGHADYAPSGDRPADQPGTLLLLAGSDSREGLTDQQRRDLGTGSEGGNVADTIMLLYMPPSGRPALISVPRDSYLAIPGHGRNKINASFALGGPKLLTATVEQATGLRVDGFLELGFGGFVGIIDALGGIEQCPTYDIDDDWAHLSIKKGCQTMDGVTALKYVRMRHADPLGDLGRVQRQRGMVTAVAKKAMSPWVVLNPVTYWQLNRAGAAALTAGAGTGLLQIAPAALAFWSISRGDGLTLTVPVSDPDLDTPVGSAVEWDKAKSARLFALIARGDAAGLDQFKP